MTESIVSGKKRLNPFCNNISRCNERFFRCRAKMSNKDKINKYEIDVKIVICKLERFRESPLEMVLL